MNVSKSVSKHLNIKMVTQLALITITYK